ncbi:hypothetical protein SprV_0802492800 [Sparganum proliferum]
MHTLWDKLFIENGIQFYRDSDQYPKRVVLPLSTKERLSGSKLYEVILEVFGAWNTDGSVTLSDLESAITKRLKRSRDSYVQRENKSQVNRDESDNIPGPSTDSPPV